MQSIMANHSMQTVTNDDYPTTDGRIPVVPVKGESAARARAAAEVIGSKVFEGAELASPYLVVGETDAWLQMAGNQVRIAFDSATMLHRRRGGQNELLGRAVGVKASRQPSVWDATGGLGRDAFVLADLGCRITLCERVPALAWLLQDAVSAARVSGHDQVRAAAERMTVRHQDSRNLPVPACDVIYLDPMFPERKKSAAIKKEAAMLQRLSHPQDDAEALWEWAWQQPVARIVVKRPLRAPVLGRQRPSHALTGKAVRFDVFVRPRDTTETHGTGE